MRGQDERIVAESILLAGIVVVWAVLSWLVWTTHTLSQDVKCQVLILMTTSEFFGAFALIRRLLGDLMETGGARIHNFAMQASGEKNVVCRRCGAPAAISTVEGSGFLSSYRLACPSCGVVEDCKYLGDLPLV